PPRASERDRLQECLRRQPRPAGEQLLQARRRLSQLVCELLQRRLLTIVEADLFNDPANHLVVTAGRRYIPFEDSIVRSHGKFSLAPTMRDTSSRHHPFLARSKLGALGGGECLP